MFGEGLELLDRVEDIDQFEDSSAEEVEFSENLGFGEVEGLSFGHVDYFLLGFFVAVLVLLVELDAAGEDFNELGGVASPDVVALLSIEDSLLTVCDHLVGDLHEKTSHLVGGVEESSDGVNHLDCVH